MQYVQAVGKMSQCSGWDPEIESESSWQLSVQASSSPRKRAKLDLSLPLMDWSESTDIFPSLMHNTTDEAMFPSDHEQSDELPSTSESAVPVNIIGQILTSSCCPKECLAYLSVKDVTNLRERFLGRSQTEQRQWLLDRLLDCSRGSGTASGSGKESKYLVAGREVCLLAWCRVLGISCRRVQRLMPSVQRCECIVEHGNKGRRRVCDRTEDARAWMERYFHLIGDKMPHNGQVHLPSWDTQKNVYERYWSYVTIYIHL